MKRALSHATQASMIATAIWLSLSFPLFVLGQHSDTEALYLICRNGLWGYSDRYGKVVIKPQYAMGGFFDHGTAEVWRKDNGRRHLIDTYGNIIENRNFASDHFSEGLIPVRIENRYGYEDEHGKMVIFPQFEYAEDFSERLAPVKVGDKWGYINPAGEFVIKPQFDEANCFSEGIAVIRVYGKLLPKEEALHNFRGQYKARDYGFINKDGRIIIPPAFDVAGDFSNGLAPVCNGDSKHRKCGYIDSGGNVAIEFKFDFAESFSEGLAPVKIGAKFGYIDTSGSVIIAPKFETALDFQGGLAYATFGQTSYTYRRSVVSIHFHGKVGYIDKTGRFAPKPLSWNS